MVPGCCCLLRSRRARWAASGLALHMLALTTILHQLRTKPRAQVQTKHITLNMLTGPDHRVRRMLHWLSDAPSQAAAGDSTAPTVMQGSWQQRRTLVQMHWHPLVQQQAAADTAAWLQRAGWAPPARGRLKPGLLTPQLLTAIQGKLSRRPLVAAVPKRLQDALKASCLQQRGQACAAMVPEKSPAEANALKAAKAAAGGRGTSQPSPSVVAAAARLASRTSGLASGSGTLSCSGTGSRVRKRGRPLLLSDSDNDGGSDRRKVSVCTTWCVGAREQARAALVVMWLHSMPHLTLAARCCLSCWAHATHSRRGGCWSTTQTRGRTVMMMAAQRLSRPAAARAAPAAVMRPSLTMVPPRMS